ncbi:hypothetical protein MKS87_07160 [Bacillus subtilis]|nr:hypothetical protein [Bacillus subtilis]MBR9950945.1 hypothetical protein [Bacillus subtilis]QKJ77389.1 hypothetical protein HR084_07110 [Bacillus subtilis]UML54189.1 hypothetical protein MKS87_07160 [Bacillus subtilis]
MVSEHAGRAQIFDKTSEKRLKHAFKPKVTDEGGGWHGVCRAELRVYAVLYLHRA